MRTRRKRRQKSWTRVAGPDEPCHVLQRAYVNTVNGAATDSNNAASGSNDGGSTDYSMGLSGFLGWLPHPTGFAFAWGEIKTNSKPIRLGC